MAESIVEKVRRKSAEIASRPMQTRAGATEQLAQQAAVSSTGKAASAGPTGQSNIKEQVTLQGAEAQKDAIAQGVQEAGSDLAIQAQQQDVQQQQVESQQRQQELKIDNQLSNTLSQYTSRIKQSETSKEAGIKALELKGKLAVDRFNNKKYVQALRNTGRNNRLEDKIDFKMALSEKLLGRGKIAKEKSDSLRRYVDDQQRIEKERLAMADIEAALQKAEADAKAAEQGALISGVAGIAGAAASTDMAKDFMGDLFSSTGDASDSYGVLQSDQMDLSEYDYKPFSLKGN